MNMLEKAARAIATADERNGGPPYEYRIQNKHAKEMLFDEVRAVLAAIRNVDNDALEAMYSAMYEGPFDATKLPMLGAGFEAAIDAILEGNENDDA